MGIYKTEKPIFSKVFIGPAQMIHSAAYAPCTLASTFLRPFAPRPLRCFFATMDALTPYRQALRTLIRGNELLSCSDQVSLVHLMRPSIHSVTNHPACPDIAFYAVLPARQMPI